MQNAQVEQALKDCYGDKISEQELSAATNGLVQFFELLIKIDHRQKASTVPLSKTLTGADSDESQ